MGNNIDRLYIGAERHCEICGKLFYVRNDYTYKRLAYNPGGKKTVFFCGWNCMRKWERENGNA